MIANTTLRPVAVIQQEVLDTPPKDACRRSLRTCHREQEVAFAVTMLLVDILTGSVTKRLRPASERFTISPVRAVVKSPKQIR